MQQHVLNATARRMEAHANATPNPTAAECVDEARKAQAENRWREAAGWWFAGSGFAATNAMRSICLRGYVNATARAGRGGAA